MAGGRWLAALNLLIYLYILAPILIVAAIAFSGTESVAFPPATYSLRWFGKFLGERELMSSLGLSVALALVSSGASLVLGTLAAFGLVRGAMPGRTAVMNALMSPLMVPALVTGISFLQYFALLGVPSLPALFLGHTVITLPYVVRTIAASLENFDIELEHAAVSLGADRLAAIRKVTLPMLANSVAAAVLFSFIVSFENLPVALFLSDPFSVTLPMRIYSYIEWVFDPTVAAASAIQVVVVVVLVLVVERLVGVSRLIALR
ncbi:MAG: ABC transporter permease [Candidatus Rokubacteria bacterium]|nr:ABC transporter permease [Candidatus Rokubacteria bacterium]